MNSIKWNFDRCLTPITGILTAHHRGTAMLGASDHYPCVDGEQNGGSVKGRYWGRYRGGIGGGIGEALGGGIRA